MPSTSHDYLNSADELLARSAKLGVCAFRFDEKSRARTDDSLACLRPLLACPVVVNAASDSRAAGPAQVLPGVRVACIQSESPIASPAFVLLLEPTALTSARLLELIRTAGLDVALTIKTLNRLCIMPGLEEQRMLAALTMMSEDCAHASHAHRLTDDLGNRLAQSYEETYTLFRIMRFAASDGEPAMLVRTLAEHLLNVLPFAWISIQYRLSPQVVESLRGEMVLAGTLPVDRGAFNRMSAEIAKAFTADNWTRVLEPSSHELAKLVNAEVVCEPITYSGSVIGVVIAGNKTGKDPMLASPEMSFLEAVADFMGTFHENIARFAEQKAMSMGTLKALTSSIDAKDPYTRGHSERVAHLSRAISLAMGFSEQESQRIHVAGLVHDIGKIGVPEAILCKAGRLTDEEFLAIKKHPEIGHRILKDVPGLTDVLPGVLHHHERYDGKGYPHGLSGENIPQIARIIGLADTFDAMSSNRSYRSAMPREKVLAEILKCAGTQFDPKVVEAFQSVRLEEFDELLAKQAGVAQASLPMPTAVVPAVKAA